VGGKLLPFAKPDPERVAKLLGGLDSPRYADREAAEAELATMADGLDPGVWKLIGTSPSLEVRRRLGRVMASFDRPTPERTLAIRAVELIEWCGTPAAGALLAAWAGGAPNAVLTREAAAARARLAPTPPQ
jgi:hypothetical protein